MNWQEMSFRPSISAELGSQLTKLTDVRPQLSQWRGDELEPSYVE
jgi:hypothetical protein